MTFSELMAVVGFKVDANSIREVNSQVNSLKSSISRALGVIGIGLSLRAMNALVESFNQANDSLRGVIESSEDLSEVTEKVRKSANEARVSYEQMAASVSKTASLDAFNTDEAIKYSENLNKLLSAYGHGDYASTVQSTLNRIMQTGQVSAGFTRMLANTPEVLDLMAKKLGTTRDKLADMAKQGKITAQTIKEAFLESSEEIDAAFAQTDIMFTDALKIIRNNWGYFLNELNDATGIGNELGHFMVDTANKVFEKLMIIVPKAQQLVKNLGGGLSVLKRIAALLATLKVIQKMPKIISGLYQIRNGITLVQAVLKGAHAQLLPIIAVFSILFLLVEDFVGFMTGKHSALEHWLESAGIDADDFREKVKNLGGNAMQFFDDLKTKFGEFWGEIEPILFEIMDKYLGPLYALLLDGLLEVLGDIIDTGRDIVNLVLEPAADSLERMLKAIRDLLDIGKTLFNEGPVAAIKKAFGLATEEDSGLSGLKDIAKMSVGLTQNGPGGALRGVGSSVGYQLGKNMADDNWVKSLATKLFTPFGLFRSSNSETSSNSERFNGSGRSSMAANASSDIAALAGALSNMSKGSAKTETLQDVVNNETKNYRVTANQTANYTFNVSERETAQSVVNSTKGLNGGLVDNIGRMLKTVG